MWMRPAIIALFSLAATCGASAQEFQIVKVPSAVAAPIKDLKPKTIFFSDHRNADGSGGFVKFEDWGRTIPVEKQFLSLYPAFTEAMVTRAVDGVTKTYKDKLQVYIAEARFSLDKPAAAIDLSKYANIEFMEKLDPQIKHQVIKPGDFLYSKDERNVNNKNPDREWCEGTTVALCLRSRYQLEGKIPMGIALANKLRDSEKRLANYVEFESELRLLGPTDIDEPGLKKTDRRRRAGYSRTRTEHLRRQPDHAVWKIHHRPPAESGKSEWRRRQCAAFTGGKRQHAGNEKELRRRAGAAQPGAGAGACRQQLVQHRKLHQFGASELRAQPHHRNCRNPQ